MEKHSKIFNINGLIVQYLTSYYYKFLRLVSEVKV